ncbi:MAG TPA: SulP family inorganic anion transporter [Verrucomicrobiae bacterium]|nr:SulP family inorganic anion transporter [Verrucomicrobiae bacterium]
MNILGPSDGTVFIKLQRPHVRMPFLQELRHYSWDKFRRDMLAGTTLTFVSIPQAIAFALILGVPPSVVIISTVVGGFFSALFFSSHHHVFGPSTSVCLITAATVSANSSLSLTPLQLAAYLAFLIGAVQLVASLISFGEVTKFISRSVVVGYTTAIGILLIASQLHNLMAFYGPSSQPLLQTLNSVLDALAKANISPWDISIGVVTIGIFLLVKWLRPKWPEALVGLVLLGVFSRIFVQFHPHLPFHIIQDEGALTAVLPGFSPLPSLTEQWAILPKIADTAIAIAIIGILEAASITKSLAAQSGQTIDPNQELMGMGVGNMAAGLCGVTPGSSSFTRSAVNYQSGAVSQMSAMYSSAAVLLILLLAAPIFNYLPVAALAAHLMRVGYHLISRAQIRIATRSTRSDAAVFFVTLLTALFLKLDTAIYAGIGVALALFLLKTSTPSLVEYVFNESGQLTELSPEAQRANPQISIIHVEGELFFGAADLFQNQIRRQAEDENIRIFILRMKNARHLDATTVMALQSLYDYLRGTNRYLLISGCNSDVMRVLRNSGLLKQIGAENVFPTEANPTVSTKRALQRARELVPERADIRLFYDRLPKEAEKTEILADYEI